MANEDKAFRPFQSAILLTIEILHDLVFQNPGVMVVRFFLGDAGFLSSRPVLEDSHPTKQLVLTSSWVVLGSTVGLAPTTRFLKSCVSNTIPRMAVVKLYYTRYELRLMLRVW